MTQMIAMTTERLEITKRTIIAFVRCFVIPAICSFVVSRNVSRLSLVKADYLILSLSKLAIIRVVLLIIRYSS